MSIFSALESKPHEKNKHKKTEIIHVKPTAEGANTIHVYYGGTEVDNFTYQVCHCQCQCLRFVISSSFVCVCILTANWSGRQDWKCETWNWDWKGERTRGREKRTRERKDRVTSLSAYLSPFLPCCIVVLFLVSTSFHSLKDVKWNEGVRGRNREESNERRLGLRGTGRGKGGQRTEGVSLRFAGLLHHIHSNSHFHFYIVIRSFVHSFISSSSFQFTPELCSIGVWLMPSLDVQLCCNSCALPFLHSICFQLQKRSERAQKCTWNEGETMRKPNC